MPTSAIASTATGLIESFGADPADKTSTRPCPKMCHKSCCHLRTPCVMYADKENAGLWQLSVDVRNSHARENISRA